MIEHVSTDGGNYWLHIAAHTLVRSLAIAERTAAPNEAASRPISSSATESQKSHADP
jgi:hypothetical protein